MSQRPYFKVFLDDNPLSLQFDKFGLAVNVMKYAYKHADAQTKIFFLTDRQFKEFGKNDKTSNVNRYQLSEAIKFCIRLRCFRKMENKIKQPGRRNTFASNAYQLLLNDAFEMPYGSFSQQITKLVKDLGDVVSPQSASNDHLF